MNDYAVDVRDMQFSDLGEMKLPNNRAKDIVYGQTDYGFETCERGHCLYYPVFMMN